MATLAYPHPPLTDGDVALRGYRESDVDAIVAACQDPEIPRWTTVPTPYGRLDAHAWLTSHAEQLANATGIPFAIVDAASDRLIGSVGLHDVDLTQRRGEVGYWVAAGARRRGVATRALRLLTAYGHADLGLLRLQLLADTRNRASQSVAERCGYVREGTLRSWYQHRGERRDMVIYSHLPSDPV